MFQSTHPRGVRLKNGGPLGAILLSFNPRTRVGCDPCVPIVSAGFLRFQSTHPRGVRHQMKSRIHTGYNVSIHAPAWGATRSPAVASAWPLSFNPRTRVGCDERKRQFSRAAKMFQSTHPRGVRHPDGMRLRVMAIVSIHAPAWGATPVA